MCLVHISQIQPLTVRIAKVGSRVSYLDSVPWIGTTVLAKILPPGPVACWFGCPVLHGHMVQQVRAAPCLGTVAIALCDGLKPKMASGQQL